MGRPFLRRLSEIATRVAALVRRIPPDHRPRRAWEWPVMLLRGLATLVVFVVMVAVGSGVALAAMGLAAAVVLGWTGTPDSLLWANVFSGAVFLATGLVVGAAAGLAMGLLLGQWVPGLAGAAAVGALLLALSTQRATPVPFDHFGFSIDRIAGPFSSPPDLRHDVLLVVDPGDPEGTRLAEQAEREGARVAAAVPGARWDVRIGVAVVDPADPGHWRIAQPPTADRSRVAAALAALPRRRSADPTGLAIALHGAVTGRPAPWWRDGAHRAVVLVLDRRPSAGELSLPGNVLWEQARSALNDTPLAGLGPKPGETELVAVTADDTALGRDWPARPALPLAARYVAPPATGSGTSALQAAERAVVDRLEPGDEDLAFAFRPHLRFDSDEHFLPIDVDAMLAERDGAGRPLHRVCTTQFVLGDDCRPVRSAYDLTGPGSYLDIAGDRRHGAGLPRELAAGLPRRPRMYYDVRRPSSTRVEIDYWWFQRFNVSPVRERNLCLAGLSVVDVTCFDHEGDWEGVTVVLARAGGRAPEIETVTYDAHGHRHRYRRDELGLPPGEAHPVVYTAYGSHASYPSPCGGDGTVLGGCWQEERLDLPLGLSRRLPEGRHDGGRDWPENDDDRCRAASCLAPLPTRAGGGGALWNAFAGHWGAARCTVFVKLCLQTTGPTSPSMQR